MIDITLKDVTYRLPTSYAEVPFHQFLAVLALASDEDNPFKQMVQVLSIIGNIPFDVLWNTRPHIILEHAAHLDFLYEKNAYDNAEPIDYFTGSDGNRYFVHNLDIAGDFICYEEVIARYKDKEYEGYPVQLALLCRRESESLESIQTDADLLKQRIDVMKNVATEDVFRIAGFFTSRGESTRQYTELSTNVRTMTQQLKIQIDTALSEHTAGTNRLSTLQAASLKLIRYSL